MCDEIEKLRYNKLLICIHQSRKATKTDNTALLTSQNHLGGGFCDGGSRSHGDSDVGLFEGGGVIDAVARHGGDLVGALQIEHDLGFVRRLHAGEAARLQTSLLLQMRRQIVEFAAGES